MSSQWLPEKLWGRLNKDNPNQCWEWVRSTDDSGYGMITIHRKTFRTHRVAWTLIHGEIPSGLLVLHTCDNPPCCNPDHLFLGTHDDNSKDKIQKGRHIYGEKSANAKLSESSVREIRDLYETGNYSHRKLGEVYGVSHTVIEQVVNLKSWKGI